MQRLSCLGILFCFLFIPKIVFAERVLVKIKGGEFTPLYGSSARPVRMPDFEMDNLPVTNKEFLNFVQKNPSWKKTKVKKIFVDTAYLSHWKSDVQLGKKAPAHSPVVNVSWFAARAFCQSEGKRLPTVNEWEYVASHPIAQQDVKKIILEWYSVPTPDILPEVKSGYRNSAGVLSMHGLIWEWTSDFNSAMVTGESRADNSLDKSLYCGSGSLGASDKSDYAAFLRFGFRSSLKANYSVANLGFRCVGNNIN